MRTVPTGFLCVVQMSFWVLQSMFYFIEEMKSKRDPTMVEMEGLNLYFVEIGVCVLCLCERGKKEEGR
ncbi:hypothetical protein L1987_59618 [Smallanthus sonchifolius]|uniref:Uncharacterized protein n=1 Tax=Smallanthus sonchifolius TaxID=185202 RepID=A0ACB9D5S2_9ASTR|nr:hypothetical protein L1987_59618 [Smallanthus sonchifolius]